MTEKDNQQQQQPQRGAPRGAAAAAAEDDNENRAEARPMVNRIREFLAQMQQHFPTADLLDINPEDIAGELDGNEEDDEDPDFDNINNID